MICQTMGRPPMSTIGLGRYSVSSRKRVPCPPHRMTTFIEGPFRWGFGRSMPESNEATLTSQKSRSAFHEMQKNAIAKIDAVVPILPILRLALARCRSNAGRINRQVERRPYLLARVQIQPAYGNGIHAFHLLIEYQIIEARLLTQAGEIGLADGAALKIGLKKAGDAILLALRHLVLDLAIAGDLERRDQTGAAPTLDSHVPAKHEVARLPPVEVALRMQIEPDIIETAEIAID